MDGKRRKKRLTPAEHAEAERESMGLKPHLEKERVCLKCGERFLSTHSGNRICKPCVDRMKENDEWY